MASTHTTYDWITERISMSLESGIGRHLWEGGRRYHVYREGRYSLPNDELEQQREELMHILVMDILDQRLFLAPMAEPPKKVMDLATGIGLWAIEMGDRYPDTNILGLDLSPIQPTSVPPNVTFQVDDVEDTWVHDDDYDFIHIREACGYMKSTPTVIESAIAHLKPGGWLELQEFHWVAEKEDGTIDPNIPVNRYMDHMMSAAASTEGRKIPIVPEIGDIMKQAGFVDIEKKTYRVPYGPWPKDSVSRRRGTVFSVNAELLLPTSDKMLGHIGLTPEQAESLYSDCVKMFHDSSIHCYATYYVWYGRKPEEIADETDR
ncbi:S-adenosyl-L-methionine-dependent methyltransferase [Xylaria bambusicola]|uniref:S-adenosyl-L-methionine-dependent methyltransferase n=1 Tax=Xylaria bambusicola TaxID=326684 RepID=UPI002007D145|nr:S-adenosyl-L-methionine-dependent methyltransferase [Xylaria bambusicola]KAI0506051.1 S-adenosyl-L-methionine-dependent methyltransferase [Xylaria bambusicola]